MRSPLARLLPLSALALLVALLLPSCIIIDDEADGDAIGTHDTGRSDTTGDVGGSCAADSVCNTACAADPDCACACDDTAAVCDTSAPGSGAACVCDLDCDTQAPCDVDAYCDPECPVDTDPDCINCVCDDVEGVCVADRQNSNQPCDCDPDCEFGIVCDDDGYCDTRCPAGVDADCGDCACDVLAVCDADGAGSFDPCACDTTCDANGACNQDGVCDTKCPDGLDPDCAVCDCDQQVDQCESAGDGTTDACSCDVDCNGVSACVADSFCDPTCPRGSDPDCPTCDCDYNVDVCEAAANGSTTTCACDPDCAGGKVACEVDDHCDTWCDPGGVCDDADCTGFAESNCVAP